MESKNDYPLLYLFLNAPGDEGEIEVEIINTKIELFEEFDY